VTSNLKIATKLDEILYILGEMIYNESSRLTKRKGKNSPKGMGSLVKLGGDLTSKGVPQIGTISLLVNALTSRPEGKTLKLITLKPNGFGVFILLSKDAKA